MIGWSRVNLTNLVIGWSRVNLTNLVNAMHVIGWSRVNLTNLVNACDWLVSCEPSLVPRPLAKKKIRFSPPTRPGYEASVNLTNLVNTMHVIGWSRVNLTNLVIGWSRVNLTNLVIGWSRVNLTNLVNAMHVIGWSRVNLTNLVNACDWLVSCEPSLVPRPLAKKKIRFSPPTRPGYEASVNLTNLVNTMHVIGWSRVNLTNLVIGWSRVKTL